MAKKLSHPLLAVSCVYALTSVLGVVAYPFLTYLADFLHLYDIPLGTFGSRFHVYLFYTAGMSDFPTGVKSTLLAICVLWVIALLISCILMFGKKKYHFFRFLILADIIATCGFLIYIFIRDDFYWGWFFSNLGYGFVLNILYYVWFSCSLRADPQQPKSI